MPHYLLDRARRRFTPTLNNIPGMGAVEKRVLAHHWKTKVLAEPPPGGGPKLFMGHERGTDRDLVTKVNDAFTITTRYQPGTNHAS